MLENIWAVEGLFSKYMLSRMSERRGLPETLMKYPDLGTGRRGVAGKYSGYHKLQILVCCISSMLLCFFFFFFGCFILLNIFVILVFMNILEKDGTSSNRAVLWYAF